MVGTLYIVATPIGNLEDITLRAIRVLKEVDLVLCENTSSAQALFKSHGITTPTSVFFAQSTRSHITKVIDMLEEGRSIALISDAGTPAISDPGVLLIQSLQEEMPDVRIVPVPGASAVTALISASGIPSPVFTFYGFIPHKKGRTTLFSTIASSPHTSIVYESVHRIEKTLTSLGEYIDDKRTIIVGRELTKMHEELVRGTSKQVHAYFMLNKDKQRGEFVILIEGKKE